MRALFEPRIAFGLECAAAALKAKAGLWTRAQGTQLAGAWEALVREDAQAFEAVSDFLSLVDADPVGAADALLAYLTETPQTAPLAAQTRQAEAILREADPAPQRYDWQDRADIGE